eukprot:GHVP01054363.1.p2 GENE.GHVP01054363.1~~GHVP01054363.1.p2  ORF type:complete len:225 (+),score=28.13 GHVP01054363.1:264-938(+)
MFLKSTNEANKDYGPTRNPYTYTENDRTILEEHKDIWDSFIELKPEYIDHDRNPSVIKDIRSKQYLDNEMESIHQTITVIKRAIWKKTNSGIIEVSIINKGKVGFLNTSNNTEFHGIFRSIKRSSIKYICPLLRCFNGIVPTTRHFEYAVNISKYKAIMFDSYPSSDLLGIRLPKGIKIATNRKLTNIPLEDSIIKVFLIMDPADNIEDILKDCGRCKYIKNFV